MSQAVSSPTSSASGTSLLPDSTELFTIGHLAIVAIFALAAIAVILWGMRLKRARKAGEREIREHNSDLADAPPESPARTAEPSPPVAPAMPPPLPDSDAAPLGVAPAPVMLPPDTGPANGPITQLKGLGPKVAQRLAQLGITTVGQVAALTDDDAAALDAQLGAFSGRMGRDRWLEQARFLAAGDKAGFEAVFGKL